jgi:hypothetical protein
MVKGDKRGLLGDWSRMLSSFYYTGDF